MINVIEALARKVQIASADTANQLSAVARGVLHDATADFHDVVTADVVLGIIAKLRAVEAELEIERDRACKALRCDLCMGTGEPAISGLPCACGGSGRMIDELQSYRQEWAKQMVRADVAEDRVDALLPSKEERDAVDSLIMPAPDRFSAARRWLDRVDVISQGYHQRAGK